jgi:AcrR family transcriptional regulator
MRALATRLGVSPNALYSHVASKDALVDELLDDALAAVQAPSSQDADPATGLHALMSSTYEVLLAQGDLVPLYLARQGARGPHAQRLGEIILVLLARGGVGEPDARQALRVLIIHTIGFAAFTVDAIDAPHAAPGRREELAGSFALSLSWLLAGIGLSSATP